VWELLPSPEGPVDVTTLRRSASTPRIRVHRSRTLDALHDVVHRDGLPVTSPMRTLLDLADVLSPHRLERVCHRAEHLRILDAAALLTPSPGRRSIALTHAIEGLARRSPEITRTELEERFLALTAEHGLPRPQVNARVCGYEVDFYWPAERLVVETDGRATHLTPTAFEEDRRRDAVLQVAGHRVVRFTYGQVVWESSRVADVLRGLL
jgi:very-short-patch-repair endonuclease